MNEQAVVLNAANERLKTGIEDGAKVVEALTQSVESSSVVVNENGMIFTSSIMRQIVQEAKTIAPHDIAVLITGESGVGKEELARFIHKESGRRGDFVPVNCGGLPETIAESVLFGHTKGAFTGAIENQIGYFQMAEGGTLFLDEIGDMSLNVQGKILRATDGHREFYPVGSKKKVSIDLRLISASNQPLEKNIQEKKFRDELFYRLNGICLNIPPLCERPDDINVLAQHFLKESCRKFNKKEELLISQKALMFFLNYGWMGNIRELKNVIERGVALSKGRILEVEDFRFSDNNLPSEENSLNLKNNEKKTGTFNKKTRKKGGNAYQRIKPVNKKPKSRRETKQKPGRKERLDKELMSKVINASNWNLTIAAVILGISRQYLKAKIKRWHIGPAEKTKKV